MATQKVHVLNVDVYPVHGTQPPVYEARCWQWPQLQARDESPAEALCALQRQLVEMRLAER